MTAAPVTAVRPTDRAHGSPNFGELDFIAWQRGYTLALGEPNQGGWWLAKADSLNSMARWLPDLDAVERALEAVK